MGKLSRGSRKGKEAWRANISTEDIDDFLEKSTKDVLTGGSLTDVPSESLFFVDKSSDLSVKRKMENNRERVLWSESVLQKNPFVRGVPSSVSKKSKKRSKEILNVSGTVQDAEKVCQDAPVSTSGMFDLWEGEFIGKVEKKPKCSIIPAVEVDLQAAHSIHLLNVIR